LHHFLKSLSGIVALTVIGVLCGLAQDQQSTPPAAGGQTAAPAAPAAKQKQYKDKGEYDLYSAVTKETDNTKKLGLLNSWKEKYPESDFKLERLQYFLNTYQGLGQPAKMIDTAKEILTVAPDDIQALYWITFLSPSMAINTDDALATASKAAQGLLNASKPAATPDADWKTAKANFNAIAYKCLGWVATVKKNNAEAEDNFKKSLAENPNAGDVSYLLGQAVLARSIAEKKPEMQSIALYHFARAAAFDGQGAMTAQGRQQVDTYLTKVYKTLHGDDSGLADLKTQAKASVMPPADFHIKTAAESASEKDEELKKTNPELALWLSIKGQLLGQDGQTYFDGSMKGTGLPKLKGWLVGAKPADLKAKDLLVSMEGKDQPADVTLRLVGSDGTTAAPLTGKVQVGYEITFEGAAPTEFTKEPLMVIMAIEKSKITDLKEDKVVAPHRPVHHK
jgi:tetratricopeptide (TPR) repeat protein